MNETDHLSPGDEPDPGSTLPRRHLGRLLRRLRERAGYSTDHAGTVLEWSRTKIWRIEKGMTSVRTFDIKAMCEVYGAASDELQVLTGLAASAKCDGWWHVYGESLPEWFEFFVGLEAAAQRIFQYESELIPGLLQTHDYAFAMLRIEDDDAEDDGIEQRVELRLQRQRVLDRRVALNLDVVMSEAAIRREVGGRRVMATQLAHLVYVADRPNVTLRVLPFEAGAHRAMMSPFAYLTFREPNEPDVIYIETRTGALYLEKPHERRSYHDAMRDLSRLALPEDRSLRLIATVAREFAS